MIISKTPFRVSLFGGSTDYESFYRKDGATLVYFGLDKYCYAAVRKTPAVFDYTTKVSYSQVEIVEDNTKIKNNAVRGVLSFFGMKRGMEIAYITDLPAQTGVGSSSSFIVGLLKAIYSLQGDTRSEKQLALEAIYIERSLLNESGGIQDQIAAAYGGLNSIHIFSNGDFDVRPLPVSKDFVKDFLDRSILIYTGKSRKSFDIAKSHDGKKKESIARIAKAGLKAFYDQDITEIGLLLENSWNEKKKISNLISNASVDKIYDSLRDDGMIGGKLLGSGGSGFIYGIVEEGRKADFMDLYNDRFIDVGISPVGSIIL